MKLLALDTSAAACSIALMLDDTVQIRYAEQPMQQAKLILPFIDDLLASNNLRLHDLSAFAFGCGPGSFTGVRIAASVVQGLAYATAKPIIAISSLAAAAQAAYLTHGWRRIGVAMDARMNEVYWGAYIADANGLMVLQNTELVCAPEKIPLKDVASWQGVGNGWSAYAARLITIPALLDSEQLPTATGVAYLAQAKFARQEWLDPEFAVPTYLRDNVAEKGK